MIRKKRRQFKKAKRTGKQNDILRYKRTSNAVRSLTRKDHYDHLEEISQQLDGNQRVFWRWLKKAKRTGKQNDNLMVIRGRSASVPNLKYMGNVVTAAVDNV